MLVKRQNVLPFMLSKTSMKILHRNVIRMSLLALLPLSSASAQEIKEADKAILGEWIPDVKAIRSANPLRSGDRVSVAVNESLELFLSDPWTWKFLPSGIIEESKGTKTDQEAFELLKGQNGQLFLITARPHTAGTMIFRIVLTANTLTLNLQDVEDNLSWRAGPPTLIFTRK